MELGFRSGGNFLSGRQDHRARLCTAARNPRGTALELARTRRRNRLPRAEKESPPLTGTNAETPTSEDLTCASELPSACRYPSPPGISLESVSTMSRATSGSAFSLMVTAAVVWGTKMWQSPFLHAALLEDLLERCP